MNEKKRVDMKVSINAYDLIPEILGSRFDYWIWWADVKYDVGYEWNRYPDDPKKKFLWLKIDDPKHEEGSGKYVRKKVSVQDIADGFVKSGAQSWRDLDAGSSDFIMQWVVLGDYVYC